MNSRNALLVLIAIASTGAYFSTRSIDQQASPSPATADVVQALNTQAEVSFPAVEIDRDAVAAHDMTLHAVRHLDVATAQPDSFRAWPAWDAQWELRSISFEHDGEVRSVYHATFKPRPDVRYTITAGAAPYEWLRAY